MRQPLRLLSDPYDGEKQRHFAAWNDESKFRTMLGRMRLDAILYDKIILTDGDLFDGIFFLDAANRGLLSEIPWQKVEIRTRAPSLYDAFLQNVKRQNSPTLARYLFSSLPPRVGASVCDGLGGCDAALVENLDQLSVLLEGLGIGADDAGRLRTGWREILAHFQQNAVPIVQRSGPFEFTKHASKAVDAVSASLRSGLGRDYFQAITENMGNRNVVMSLLTPEALGRTQDELSDIATMYTWYNGSYRATQAEQHACNNVEVFISRNCRPFIAEFLPNGAFTEEAETNIVEVPKNFLLALGTMDGNQLNRFVSGPRMLSCIEQWKARRSVDELKRGMDFLVQWVEVQEGFSAADDLEGNITKGLSLAGAALGGGLGAMVSNDFTRRGFFALTSGAAGGAVGWLVGEPISNLVPTEVKRVAASIVTEEKRRHHL